MDKSLSTHVADFFKQYKHQLYQKGEILIRADDDPSGIFYLKKGTVKQYAISKKGEEIIINIFKSNTFFPMSWAINGTKNNYYFEAITDAEVYRAAKEDVIEFIQKNPDVSYNLLKRVYIGTDGLLARMVYLMSENAYDRLVIELLIHVKRFGKKNIQGLIEVPTSEIDLAARSGMTRETVSREMKKLKDKQLLTLTKNILVIKDLTQLEKELSIGN